MEILWLIGHWPNRRCCLTTGYNTLMVNTRRGLAALSIGALGVVFGDIGTSPLYALQVVFGPLGLNFSLTSQHVYGVISLIIWSVTLVVSIKYLAFIVRADNKGEGGILALVTLLKGSKMRVSPKWVFIVIGLIGVSLFYGDSIITPAISVLSALEGLKVVAPSLTSLVIPVTLIILTMLFAIQRFGTGLIGRYFGPVMLAWFVSIGLGGAWQLSLHPDAWQALSPLAGLRFFAAEPLLGMFAMGAVVLAITGAEALYADLGHFGRSPIRRAWLFIVFPALALCYMGQGAVLLHGANTSESVFFQLYPSSVQVIMVLLATLATIIASQSVISGAFSLTRQAIQLGFLPRMRILHTSIKRTGQIYLPLINVMLYIMVLALVLLFGSSARLASAYGVAVSGTLATDTILFLAVMRTNWQSSRLLIAVLGVLFVPVDLLFIVSNAPKFWHGGWFPLSAALVVFVVITTWITGEAQTTRERRKMEGSVHDFVSDVHSMRPPIERSPGVAVYIGHHPDFTPLALRATIDDLHELPKTVVIVSVQTTNEAHVPEDERATYDDLGFKDGISQIKLRYGFHDAIHVPSAIKAARTLSSELNFDIDQAAYFVSLSKVTPTKSREMAMWRKHIFVFMARNELSPSDYFSLPIDRTEEMTTLIRL
jgi:KUP system potassium uptake protein